MNKKSGLSVFILLVIFFLFSSFSIKNNIVYENKEYKWKNIFKKEGISQFLFKNNIAFSLKENEYEYNDSNDLILHFNAKYKENLKIYGNYIKKTISYIPDSSNSILGKASASFSLHHHRIELFPTKNSIFYPGKILKSFIIDFWLYPQASYEGNTIFSYYGPTYIKEFDKIDYAGIRCYLEKNQVKLNFSNIFYLKDNPVSFEILTNVYLDIASWQHIAISYNALNGKLVITKNNKKKKIIWVTETGKENGTLLVPKITEYLKVPFNIGNSFFGNIDEFHIGKYFCEEFNLSKYITTYGEIVSKVIDFNYYSSYYKNFKTISDESNKTKVYVFARASEEIFDENDNTIPWIKATESTVLKGRYLQWKLKLYPSFNGNYTPLVYDLKYDFVPNYPPSKPARVSYELLGNGKVLIKWEKNLESDIKGYYVYYGKKSRFYIDHDAEEGASPIFTKDNYIILTLPKYIQYYISVRTVDKAYINQKSVFSDEIIVRPE